MSKEEQEAKPDSIPIPDIAAVKKEFERIDADIHSLYDALREISSRIENLEKYLHTH